MKAAQLFTHHPFTLAPGVTLAGMAGEHLMVTHLHFDAGAVGAIHAHPHEQITVVLMGEVTFTLGEEHMVLTTGQATSVPGNVPHGVVAHTEAEVLDIFTPLRADLALKLGI